MSKLTLKAVGDTQIIGTRRFAASPEQVFRAIRTRRWCGNGCWAGGLDDAGVHLRGAARRQDSLRVGKWQGGGFYLTGEFEILEPPHRIVHVERMHLPDATPDNRVETTFEADGTGTLMTVRMTLPDAATRAGMLATGMEQGMEASYVRLDSMAVAP